MRGQRRARARDEVILVRDRWVLRGAGHMNTTWHSEKPPRCYGAICAALVVSTSMGQVARRVCKGSAWAYTLRVTPTCWHHDFVIVTAGRDLATLAALCIYCTQHNQSKHIPAIVP